MGDKELLDQAVRNAAAEVKVPVPHPDGESLPLVTRPAGSAIAASAPDLTAVTGYRAATTKPLRGKRLIESDSGSYAAPRPPRT